jgi:hypothetical protein
MPFRMIAPGPYLTFQTRGGGYGSDANSVVGAVANSDVLDMLGMGCLLVEYSQDQTYFGGLGVSANFATFKEEGNLYRNAANPIGGNGADTTDDILAGIALDAGAFDIAGRGLCITGQGKLGATANNKRFRLWLNPAMSGQSVTNGVISGGQVTGAGSGVMAFDSGTGANALNNVGWSLMANLFKYGAGGSNTQYFQATPIYGTTHGGVGLPVFTTLAENAVMNIVLTGASQTTGAANDVVLNFFEINAMD